MELRGILIPFSVKCITYILSFDLLLDIFSYFLMHCFVYTNATDFMSTM